MSKEGPMINRMKSSLLGLGLGAAVLATGALAPAGEGARGAPSEQEPGGIAAAQTWSMTVRRLATDSCGVGCPCLFGLAPAGDIGRRLAIAEVEDGSLGGVMNGVSLRGLRWAVYSEYSGETRAGPRWQASAFYVDALA